MHVFHHPKVLKVTRPPTTETSMREKFMLGNLAQIYHEISHDIAVPGYNGFDARAALSFSARKDLQKNG